MFDTMTMTKLLGGLCGTFLIFLLGKFGAEFIYHEAKHHGDDHHQAGYVIDTGAEESGGEEIVTVPFAEVFAAADAGAGEKLFRQCSACHALEAGKNGTGPYLVGVVGRALGAADGYSYSGGFADVADAWTPENLNSFIENPKGFASDTKMAYRGMKDIEDRANLIAYLQTIN